MGTVVAIIPTPAAAAPEPGMTVDPQSPAGVEYQIPLETGRGHGTGKKHGSGGIAGATGNGGSGGANGSPGGTAPTLFGSGITPRNGSGAGSGKSGKGSGAAGQGAGGQAGASGSDGSALRSIAPVTASANYSTTGPIAGIVAAIVLVGVGLGLYFRRRNRPRRIFS